MLFMEYIDVLNIWLIEEFMCLNIAFVYKALTKIFLCRFLMTALELLGKLVATFGPIIHATRTSASSIGVDLQAEQRYVAKSCCQVVSSLYD